MRSALPALLLSVLAVGCGGSTSRGFPDGDRVPATPLPNEQVAASRATGFVTVLSVEGGTVTINPRFFEDLEATRSSASPCSLSRNLTSRPSQVSAGDVTVVLPTREGDQDFRVAFDAKTNEYEMGIFDAFVEPGAVMRVSARGGTAPAFDAEVETAANVAFDVPEELVLDANAPKDIPLGWAVEGDNDEVFVDLSVSDASITCWFDSKTGGTIPSALVTELLQTGGTCDDNSCWLILASKHERSVVAGDWTIVLAHGFASMKKIAGTR